MKKAIVAIAVLVVVVAVVVTLCLMPEFTYNDPDTVGNTAGNIYNGGVFCEYDNKVYFANPYDTTNKFKVTI